MGLQLSGSVQLEGNLLVTGSTNSVFQNVLVSGRLTAQEIQTQLVSSSIIYSSGSNKFGDLITDTQQFTGSLRVSGSSHHILGNLALGTTTADVFSRGDERNVGISVFGASENMALQLNAGSSAGRGAQIYMGQGGTRHFTLSSNATETRVGTTTNTPLILTTNDTTRLTIANSTGVATFSNSVGISGLNLTSTYASRLGLYTATAPANMELGTATNTNGSIVSRLTSYNANNGNAGNESSVNFMGVASIETQLVTANSNATNTSGGNIIFRTKREGGTLDTTLTLASAGAATFTSSVTALVNNISADGVGVVLQGYIDNTLRIAVRGSGYNDGARGGLFASTGDFGSSVTANYGGTFTIPSESPASGNVALTARTSNGANDVFRWFDGATQLGVFKNSGNVGIGTPTPDLENGGGQVIFNSTVPRLAFRNSTSGTTALDGTDLALVSSDFFIFNREAGSVILGTSGIERMRITSGGYLKASNNGVYNNATGTFHELTQNLNGASSAILTHGGTSDPYGLEVNFTGHDPNNATNYMFGAYKTSGGFVWIYRIFSNGTVSARSDARWKKNIETTRNGYIDDLCKLRVVKYNWYNHEDDAPKELGLIAQEVEEVFPNLVQHDPVISKREVEQEDGSFVEEEFEDGVSRSIKTSVLPFMLLKAMQEQQQQIETLKAKIEALENI